MESAIMCNVFSIRSMQRKLNNSDIKLLERSMKPQNGQLDMISSSEYMTVHTSNHATKENFQKRGKRI
jgi:hypothetical protein